jgi:hypothetical protein
MADYRPYLFGDLVEEQEAETVRELAVALLREGCTHPHFLNDLADLLDNKVKTNLIVSISKPKHRVAIKGGEPHRIAEAVWDKIGRMPETAAQVFPAPPIDDQRAIAIVAEAENLSVDTVTRYWNRVKKEYDGFRKLKERHQKNQGDVEK